MPRRFEHLPWNEAADLETFKSPEWTRRLLEDLRPVHADEQEQIAQLVTKHLPGPLRRLQALAARLADVFADKEELIKMVIIAAIAHQPMLIVGKPGTAKSKIVLKFCEGLGLGRTGQEGAQNSVFQYQLHGFTEPDEILGMVNVKKMMGENPKFERLHKGSIVEASVVFLDEVFRANSAILNALLSVMNERQVYDGGELKKTEVRVVYGASNEPPRGRQLDDLKAFYSRFLIRMESTFVPMEIIANEVPKARKELLEKGWRNEVSELRSGYLPAGSAMQQVSCLNDVLLLNRAVADSWGGADLSSIQPFVELYHRLVAELSTGDFAPCEIDDRKFVRLLAVIRAYALYHNHDPGPDDLVVLKHTWEDIDSRMKLASVVDRFIANASPVKSKTGAAR